MTDPLDAEDAKLVTLARGSRARAGAPEGAAVRDEDGRTYAAATVTLPSLRLTALQAAVAAAVSSGAQELEAAVLVSTASTVAEIDPVSRAAAADLGAVVLILAGPDGAVRDRSVR
ncbi:MAG TPA: cytidine deaminase [Nakamurella sp.]